MASAEASGGRVLLQGQSTLATASPALLAALNKRNMAVREVKLLYATGPAVLPISPSPNPPIGERAPVALRLRT